MHDVVNPRYLNKPVAGLKPVAATAAGIASAKPSTRKIKYLDWVALNDINNRANREGRNAKLSYKTVDALSIFNKYPVGLHFLHNDKEIRCQLWIGENERDFVWLDLTFGEFEHLPEIEVENGEN